MNKAELIDEVAAATGLPKKSVADVLDTAAVVVIDHLSGLETGTTEEVVLPGLGKLKTNLRPARTGRNPQTGEAVEIPERLAVKFAPAKALKDALNP